MTKNDIQFVRSLHDKSSRAEHGLFIAEGEKLIGEIIKSGLNVQRIYALEGVSLPFDVECISPKEMERISTLKSANNSVAVVEIPHYELDVKSLKGKLVLALDEVQNPGNLGTIIRLADWFGIEDIICSPTTADLYNPKVVQATMGAITRVRVHYTPLVPFLKGCGVAIYGTLLDGDNIYKTPLSSEGVIVMGNEGRGLSREVIELIDKPLYIPPYPADCAGSESLNVAIATAIVCSEFRRS
ncbi:MAG: RNA methyltransferase [Rikenellaceae bacterium]